MFLFFSLPYFIKQDFHDQTSIHWTAGHSLTILQRSVITEPIKFSSQTRSTKIIIISLQGWKKFSHLFRFLHPLYCRCFFFWLFLVSRKKNHLHSFVFSPSFEGYGGKTFYLVCQFVDIIGDQQKGKSDISKSCYVLWYATLQKIP